MPHHHMVIPHYMGRSREIDIEEKKDEDTRKEIVRQDSFSSESPMQDIPLLLPQEADGIVTSNGDRTNFSEISPLMKDETLVSDTQTKDFQDDVLDDWWEAPEATNDDTTLDYGQVGPRTTCQCQVSYDA